MFDSHLRDQAIERRRQALEEERQRLFDVVCHTLEAIRERYHIRVAYVTGSLLQPHRWTPISDVDVAVGGCSEHLLDIMRELEGATDRPVDVIDLETYPVRNLITRRGRKLYGAP